jgi:YD repeat-containing protein
VAHLDAEHREQPIVRITRDADGRLLEAFDADTAETGWKIRSVRVADDPEE